MGYHIAIVGITGLVGRRLLAELAVLNIPIASVVGLASPRSVGQSLPYRSGAIQVESLIDFDFSNVQIALFAVDEMVAVQYVPKALASGCYVIDNSTEFRQDQSVPLIVPEINGHLLSQTESKLFSNPNCLAIQMLMVLSPILKQGGLLWVQVATYQSVSGAGQSALDQFYQDSEQRLAALKQQKGSQVATDESFAFNVRPQIGAIEANGYSSEEIKIIQESRKILQAPYLDINPTCVRVSVAYGHSCVLHLRTKIVINEETMLRILNQAKGIRVISDRVPTPDQDGVSTPWVTVGRIRPNMSDPYTWNVWVVADNLSKGAASNMLQMMASLHQMGLFKATSA